MEELGKLIVERMSNLGEWELYRFADEETDEVVCKIALRGDAGEIEYGVWRKEDVEPSATGSLDGEEPWGDAERERVLQEIARIYEDGVPEVVRGLKFQIGDLEVEEEEGLDDEEEDEDEEDPEEEA